LRDRHKRRCRERLTHPKRTSKRRSCLSCAASKLRCDAQQPACSRCFRRSSLCQYTDLANARQDLHHTPIEQNAIDCDLVDIPAPQSPVPPGPIDESWLSLGAQESFGLLPLSSDRTIDFVCDFPELNFSDSALNPASLAEVCSDSHFQTSGAVDDPGSNNRISSSSLWNGSDVADELLLRQLQLELHSVPLPHIPTREASPCTIVQQPQMQLSCGFQALLMSGLCSGTSMRVEVPARMPAAPHWMYVSWRCCPQPDFYRRISMPRGRRQSFCADGSDK
jgi:hypothetical protein